MPGVKKEIIVWRKKLFIKNSSILELLRRSGGALYNIHLESLLNISKSTLRGHLSKLESVGLVSCDVVDWESTTRTVTRLTATGWRMFGTKGELGSAQDERLSLCLLKACHYLYFMKDHEDNTNEFFELLNAYHNSNDYTQITINDKYYDNQILFSS